MLRELGLTTGLKPRRLGEVENMESDQAAQQCQSSCLECTWYVASAGGGMFLHWELQ